MARKDLTRFRLCAWFMCCKGAVTPKGRKHPNGWTLDDYGRLWCPKHTHLANRGIYQIS